MIAVVVPTIRKESYKTFRKSWNNLFKKHEVELITVWDGETPVLEHNGDSFYIKDIMGKDSDLIYNFNDGIRNLGFAYVQKRLEADIVITLDDDVEPCGDTIEDHLTALFQKVPVSWMSTGSKYTRGFPYGLRDEAEVMLSHGVWHGVADWDAPTQLINGNQDISFFKGPIPKGIFYPMCIMNVAFRREMIPYMYQAPMGKRVGIDRFADIWCGIESKKVIDQKGWAVVSGYASVWHNRASNVWTNLKKEAVGLEMNERYGEGEYFELYARNRKRWKEFCG